MSLQNCRICCSKTSRPCFTVPLNENKRMLWIESTGVNLCVGNKICEKHFSESAFYYAKNLKRRRLLPDVMPMPDIVEQHEASASGNNMCDFGTQTEKEIIDAGIALENIELKTQVRKLMKENELLRNKLKVMEKLSESVKLIFTESQIKKMQTGCKRVNWTAEDISYGICLQAAGPRAYRHLLKKGFPLPCVSSLLKWSQSLKVQPGLLSFVIGLMEKSVDIEDKDKICVLVFDEMKVTSAYKNDSTTESVQKPADYVQVAMVQGLRRPWKQPIYFDFNKPMTTEVLYLIIDKLYAAGYHVVAMVSDLAPGNYKIWSQLQISAEKPWFEHPSNADMKIFIFADAPHLIKLIRNHFIDSGLIVGGKKLTVQTIKQAMNYASASDLSILWKVTEEHLNVRTAGRQKVKLATQLFSNTTASGIRRCYSLGLQMLNASETADFIQMVNDWFDIFNVKLSTANTMTTKQPFGKNLFEQQKVLSDMTALMSLPIVPNGNNSLPFQKGIIVSNASLQLLYDYVTNKYDMKYLVASRISQEPLEHFFGAMRSEGGLPDHPSAMQFKLRLRKYLLGKGFKFDNTL